MALVAVMTGQSLTSAQPKSNAAVQERFSAEDGGVKRPAAIPSEVMKILADDAMVRTQMENEEPRPAELSRSWFSASEIRLGPTKKNDLIIQAAGPLRGANVDVFWVFIFGQDGWKLALLIPAHDLIVMRARFKGYRKIEADAMTCCTVTTARFRFDGSRYEQYFTKTDEIK